jgi:hypothetical protein
LRKIDRILWHKFISFFLREIHDCEKIRQRPSKSKRALLDTVHEKPDFAETLTIVNQPSEERPFPLRGRQGS